MIYGYARISTADQSLDRQLLELKKFNCDQIITDKISGSKFIRTGLDSLLATLISGDTVVVTQLDRLGRSLKELLALIEQWEKQNINFVAINQGLDTRTSTGKLIFSILGAVAEFERNLLIERTNQGLTVARAKGKLLGRKPSLNYSQKEHLKELLISGKTNKQIAEILNISESTLYRYRSALKSLIN